MVCKTVLLTVCKSLITPQQKFFQNFCSLKIKDFQSRQQADGRPPLRRRGAILGPPFYLLVIIGI